MKVVTFASFKGGSGKTTTAIATAAALVDGGEHRVFVLDLDHRQNSLYRWLNDTRQAYGDDAPPKTVLDGASIDPELAQDDAIHSMYETIRRVSREAFDVCIVDTRGTQNEVAISAMHFSDLVIVPIQISGVEIEPFVVTYKLAEKAVSFENAKVVGLVTRMPNGFASTTVLKVREVLARYDIELIEGTSQRDGYQQLLFQAGTFAMIGAKFAKAAEEASDYKLRKRANSERGKAETAGKETVGMLGRLELMKVDTREDET